MKILKLRGNIEVIRFWENTKLIYFIKDTGEILKEIEYIARPEVKTKDLSWRYFAGCKSPTEVILVKNHMENFFKLHKINKEDYEYKSFREEYVRALCEEYPLSISQNSEDWILDLYESCMINNRNPSSLWFDYEYRVTITKDLSPTREDLEKIRRLLGYRKGWVWYKLNELEKLK